MKKIYIFLIVAGVVAMHGFAAENRAVGFEAGIGSGFIVYGDKAVRARNSSFNASNQIIIAANGAALVPLAEAVYFAVGVDSTFDLRWKGGEHINYVDYAGTAGFRVYPGLAGLVCTVDYAIGRRTDFISYDGNDETIENTLWGNGFKFGFEYDFTTHTSGFAPILGTSWRHMPRGDSSDDIFTVFFKVSGK